MKPAKVLPFRLPEGADPEPRTDHVCAVLRELVDELQLSGMLGAAAVRRFYVETRPADPKPAA